MCVTSQLFINVPVGFRNTFPNMESIFFFWATYAQMRRRVKQFSAMRIHTHTHECIISIARMLARNYDGFSGGIITSILYYDVCAAEGGQAFQRGLSDTAWNIV